MATYDLASSSPSVTILKAGDILNCSYSGAYKQITLPKGQYKLECWGAQGGAYSSIIGGKGGYSSGVLTITEKTLMYLYVGGSGSSSSVNSGFNGGGNGIVNGRGGGGGSDIRINQDSLYARVIVAGGGGGAGVSVGSAVPAGCGGGLYGGDGYFNDTTGTYITGTNRSGGSASQTAGGITWSLKTQASFGQGGNASGYSCGGGGGGWYGGGGAYDNDSDSDGRYGGGGSGYVYTSSTASNYPSGCLLNSSYYLTDAATYAGSTSFTSPSGTSETGHTGDGYIRITILQIKTTEVYIKIPAQLLPSSYTQLEYIKGTGTQYIDTGFTPNSNTKVEMEVSFSNISSGNYNLWCSRDTFGSQTFTCFYIGGSGFRSDYNTTMYSTSKTCSINEKVLVVQDKNNFYLNNSLIYTHTIATFICPYPMLLLASQQGGATSNLSNYHQGNVYYCKIYDNGTLVRNFVPAQRNSDNVLGLYDLANNKFYTNAGTETFIAGPESNPWKQAKNIYIKINGKWINGEV